MYIICLGPGRPAESGHGGTSGSARGDGGSQPAWQLTLYTSLVSSAFCSLFRSVLKSCAPRGQALGKSGWRQRERKIQLWENTGIKKGQKMHKARPYTGMLTLPSGSSPGVDPCLRHRPPHCSLWSRPFLLTPGTAWPGLEGGLIIC